MRKSNINWIASGESIDRAVIDRYGEQLNVKLPEEYVGIALENNGAHPTLDVFDIKGREEAVFDSLLEFNPEAGPDIFQYYDILKSNSGIDRLLPFARDPFGNLICFDYRETDNNPPIVFWDHEADSDAGEEPLHFIANSFGEFLDMLYEPDD